MKQPYKILWAEDEEILREVMCDLLTDEGHECVAAANGEEAKKFLLQDEYDVLISDFKMPELDGAHLLLWCRENNLHLPVIFVSGGVDRSELEELALKDCCSSILNKPFSIETLLVEIEKAKRRSHEFECNGRTIPSKQENQQKDFTGRHYC